MHPRVYLIAFLISIVLAVVSGIVFRFLEIDHEAETAKRAHAALQQLLGN